MNESKQTVNKTKAMGLEQLKLIIYHIEKENTGTHSDFAKKINVTNKLLSTYIDILKEQLDAPIVYDPDRKSYIYAKKGKFNWEWEKK
jgi:hypothetical protein